MNLIEQLQQLAGEGIEITRQIRGTTGNAQAINTLDAALGWRSSHVKKIRRLSNALFGPLAAGNDPDARATAITLAEEHRLSLDSLLIIQSAVSQLKHREDRETFRLELTRAAAELTPDELHTISRNQVRLRNETAGERRDHSATLSKTEDAGGFKHLHFKASASEMNRIAAGLHERIVLRLRANAHLSYAHAFGDVVAEALLAPEGWSVADRRLPAGQVVAGRRPPAEQVMAGRRPPAEQLVADKMWPDGRAEPAGGVAPADGVVPAARCVADDRAEAGGGAAPVQQVVADGRLALTRKPTTAAHTAAAEQFTAGAPSISKALPTRAVTSAAMLNTSCSPSHTCSAEGASAGITPGTDGPGKPQHGAQARERRGVGGAGNPRPEPPTDLLSQPHPTQHQPHHLTPASPERYVPAVLLSMDDFTHHRDRDYVATDGTILTPEQFAAAELEKIGYALVYDANAEPIDLFRIQRMANSTQRTALAIDQILCAHPDCYRPAVTSQAHHLTAWKNGGETNLANLAALCAEHNAWNDDDREQVNGHAVRDAETGQVGWQPPDPNEPPRYNVRPAMALNGRAWAHSRRDRSGRKEK